MCALQNYYRYYVTSCFISVTVRSNTFDERPSTKRTDNEDADDVTLQMTDWTLTVMLKQVQLHCIYINNNNYYYY